MFKIQIGKSKFVAPLLMITVSVGIFIPKFNNIVNGVNTNEVQNITEENITEESFSLMYLRYKNDLKNKDVENISVEDISDNDDSIIEIQDDYIILDVPTGKEFKSYMDAKTITNKNTAQYQLKYSYELDYNTGIYTVNGRYCAALGSYYTEKVGTYFDIVMKSGEIIPCILADVKADKHTDELNQYTVRNNSTVEFIVDTQVLVSNLHAIKGTNTGDISHLGDIFDGELAEIRIYESED